MSPRKWIWACGRCGMMSLNDTETECRKCSEPRKPYASGALRDRSIVNAAADPFGVTAADVLGHSVFKSTARARATAVYLMRKPLSFSYPEIGRALGYRDHTSPMAAMRRIEKAMTDDTEIAVRVRAAEAALGVGPVRAEVADDESRGAA